MHPGSRHNCGVTVLTGGKFMTDQSGKSEHEVADYISTMTAQLAQMAAAENFILLAHLLEMAWLEAEQLCGRQSIAPPRRFGHDDRSLDELWRGRTTNSFRRKISLAPQCLSCRRAATAKPNAAPSDMTAPLAHGSPAASA